MESCQFSSAADTIKEAELQRIADAFDRDGLVALAGVVDRGEAERLHQRMQEDIVELQRRGPVPNNFQGIRPPPFAPWLFDSILKNDVILTVLERILGRGFVQTAYGANTAFIGSTTQQVHADIGIPAGLSEPEPCRCLVVNVPLIDFTARNGATQIWPGTHRETAVGERHISAELLDKWGQRRPPIRPLLKVGDAAIRDMRVFHGGMPNQTQVHRIMLAMIFVSADLASGGFEIEAGSEDFFSHPKVRYRVGLVPKPIDYLKQHHSKPATTVLL